MKKGHPFSHLYNINQRYTYLVCICRSTTPLFITAILPNIQQIRLPWGNLYIVNFMGEMRETQKVKFGICMSRSTTPLFKTAILPNVWLI